VQHRRVRARACLGIGELLDGVGDGGTIGSGEGIGRDQAEGLCESRHHGAQAGDPHEGLLEQWGEAREGGTKRVWM